MNPEEQVEQLMVLIAEIYEKAEDPELQEAMYQAFLVIDGTVNRGA